MKKIILVIISFLLVLMTYSQEINSKIAKRIALDFFKNANNNINTFKKSSIIRIDSVTTYFVKYNDHLKTKPKKKLPAFYIINRKDKPSFVIIAGDKRVKTILGYSFKHRFNPKNLPTGLNYLFKQYQKEIAYAITNIDTPTKAKQVVESPKIIVNNLLQGILWDQWLPYNLQTPICPYKNYNDNASAGCVAIAMAQIMYYYKHPFQGSGSFSYQTKTLKIKQSAYFGHTKYFFQTMNDPESSWYDPENIAEFVHHVGISVKMDYGDDHEGGSGAYNKDIPYALNHYFDYKKASFISKELFTRWTSWYKIINNELDNGRPLIYGANENKLTHWIPEAHTWIIAGRDDENRYFMDWGWKNGIGNGFYLLTSLKPKGKGISKDVNFNYGHEMVIGIEPNMDFIPPKILNIKYTHNINTQIALTFSEPIERSSVMNTQNYILQGSKSGIIKNFTISYNPETLTCKIIPNQPFKYDETVRLTVTTGIKDLAGTGIRNKNGNSLDGDGDGTPGPNYTASFTTTKYQHDYAITAITLSNPSPIIGEEVEVTATVKNNGINIEPNNQTIDLYNDGKKVYEYNYLPSIKPDKNKTQKLYYTPKKGGLHKLAVKVSLKGDQNPNNNTKELPIIVGTVGNLVIDGEQNPQKSLTLSPGTSGTYTLNLQNTGSKDITATITKNGSGSNLTYLISGKNISIPKNNIKVYNYRITADRNTPIGEYFVNIVFLYENGKKTTTVPIAIKIVDFNGKPFEKEFSSGKYHGLIDGNHSDTYTDLIQKENGDALFYLDNDPKTAYPPEHTDNIYISQDKYNRLNYGRWYLYHIEKVKGDADFFIGVKDNGGHVFSSGVTDENYTDILEWFKPGNNTIEVSLSNYIVNGGGAEWEVNNSDIFLVYSKAAWAGNCTVDNHMYSIWERSWDQGRLYFNIKKVYTKGNLTLYNNGKKIRKIYISPSDEGHTAYFYLRPHDLSNNNNLNIKASYKDKTKVKISNIRLIVKYYNGEPNLISTKTLSKSSTNINENISVNLKFKNTGSNIVSELHYNDTPLPEGLVFVSGSINDDWNDLEPGEEHTENYKIKANKPGIYTFGATTISYTDGSGKKFKTQFNTVTLKVIGGSLNIKASLDTNRITIGDSIKIKAKVTIGNTSKNVNDAIVQCQIVNNNTNKQFSPFFLFYDETSGYYKGSFNQTLNQGIYNIMINAKKNYYSPGITSQPLQCTVLPKPYLNVTPKTQFIGAEITKAIYRVSSNVNWDAFSDSKWINSVEKHSDSIFVLFAPNITDTIRSANIYVRSKKIPFKIVTLNQKTKKQIIHAAFESDQQSGYAPLCIYFSNKSSGEPTKYLWEFGDGDSSTLNNVIHIYKIPGKYTVSLIASNQKYSDTIVKTDYITALKNPLQAILSLDTLNSYPNESISVPIKASNFTNVKAFQFTITYDKTKLEFENCTNWGGGANADAVQVDATSFVGKITFSYNDAPINLSSGKLVDINFKIKNGSSGNADILWTDAPTVRKILNSQGMEVPCTYLNGTVNILSGFTLSGKLTYSDDRDTPLGNIPIYISDKNNQLVANSTTDATGDYSFTGLSNGNYKVFPKIDLPWKGVTAMDVTIYKKYIGHIISLSDLKARSGDVNGNSQTTVTDMTLIMQRIGQKRTSFSVGDWLNDKQEVSISGENSTLNLQAICYGDANGSYFSDNTKSTGTGTFNPAFQPGTTEIRLPKTGFVRIPFVLNKAVSKLSSVTLKMNYPSTLFKVKSIKMAAHNNDLYYNEKNGVIYLVYSTLQPLTLQKGDTLFTVQFSIRKDAEFKNTGNYLPTFLGTGEFGDFNDNVLQGIKLNYSKINANSVKQYLKDHEVRLYPNPASQQITITHVAHSQIAVYDMYGKCLLKATPDRDQLKISLKRFSPGAYSLRVKKDNHFVYKKFIVLSH